MLFGSHGKLTPLFRGLFFAFAGIAIYVGTTEGFSTKSQIFGFIGFAFIALTHVSPTAKKDKREGE